MRAAPFMAISQPDSLKMVGAARTPCFSGSAAHLAPNSQHGELSLSEDESILKVRKPYTITKQRERWTEEEHERFLEALKLYGRAWRHIEEHIGTKTAVQIRSHAQKFFSKLERKQSEGETYPGVSQDIDIPPPRPKRKPNHPYPRKATTSPASNPAVTDKKVAAAANSSHASCHPGWEREIKDEKTRTPSSSAVMPGSSVKNIGVSSERSDGSIGQSELLQSNSDQKVFCESSDELNVDYKTNYKPLFEKVERTSGDGSLGTTSNTTVNEGDCSMQNSNEMLFYGPIHPTIIAGTCFKGLDIPAIFQHQAMFDREHSAHLAGFSRICGPANPFVLPPSAEDIISLPCQEIASSNDKEGKPSKIKDTVPALAAATVAAASAWWALQGFIAPGLMNPCSWPPIPSLETLSAIADIAKSKNVTKVQQITVPEGAGPATMPINPKRQGLKMETLQTLSRDLSRNFFYGASDQLLFENESHDAETTLTLGSCRPSNEKHLERERKAVSSESSYGCAHEVLELKDRIELFRTSIVDCTETTSNLENGYMEKGISSEVNGGKSNETKGVSKRLSVDVLGDEQSCWQEPKRPRIAADDEMNLETANGAGRPHFGGTVMKLGRDFGGEDTFEQVKLPRMFVGSQIEEAAMDKHTLKQVFGHRESCPRRVSMKLVERNGHETGKLHQECRSSLLHEAVSQGDSLDTINKYQNQACSSMRMDTKLEHSGSASASEAEEDLNPYQDVEETTASSPNSVLDLATGFPQKKQMPNSAELFLPTALTTATKRYSGVGFVPYCRPLRNS